MQIDLISTAEQSPTWQTYSWFKSSKCEKMGRSNSFYNFTDLLRIHWICFLFQLCGSKVIFSTNREKNN